MYDVSAPRFANTLLRELGMKPDTMPVKPMSVERCVADGRAALSANRATHVAGRMNRVMAAVMPHSVVRGMMVKMATLALATKPRLQSAAKSESGNK